MRTLRLALALGAAGMAGSPASASAHEVPARVAVHLLARADSSQLRLVVRVPLEAVRDIDFPTWRGDYLDIGRATPLLHEAATIWIAGYLELFEGTKRLPMGRVVATRISLPSDRSFEDFERALANTSAAPLPNETELPWRQAMLDVVLSYPIESPASRFSIRPLLAHLGVSTTTVMRWTSADGGDRAYEYTGNPGLVELDPGVMHAAGQFIRLGFTHILGGIDHLLFLLCLVIPFRRVRPLIGVVTAFTAAHSITLIASALGLAPSAPWFPPLIEVLIAASIVLMALENVVGPRLDRRWMVAFGFGLVHGFGFSFALRDAMQFAGRHLITSLLAFNVGVELGQLLAIAALVPALALLFRHVVAERAGTVVFSAIVAHESWHWMTERFGVLRAYRFTWPALDLALVAVALRGLMLLLVIGAVLWMVAMLVTRLAREPMRDSVGHAGRSLLLASVLGTALSAVVPAALQGQSSGSPGGEALRSTRAGVFTDAQAARGKDVYVGSCRECHVPASHTGVVFKNSWGGKRLSELLAYMTERMPKNSPGSLTGEEYAAVTAYILMLNGYPSGDEELPYDSSATRRIRIEASDR
ncbi:MAG: HupE/UreJ family protein [Gemmatimonadaceae bacterium]|nr:HupE/UreJ family protein [Gemmatimonadaceae bacterium]